MTMVVLFVGVWGSGVKGLGFNLVSRSTGSRETCSFRIFDVSRRHTRNQDATEPRNPTDRMLNTEQEL